MTEQQQSYFLDSKARDKNGNLQMVYHGGMVENSFDTTRGGDDSTQYGAGAYFTDSEYYASEYSYITPFQERTCPHAYTGFLR